MRWGVCIPVWFPVLWWEEAGWQVPVLCLHQLQLKGQ
jgi:hypothetical protein